MDKEKILSASRSENRHGDEMKRFNSMKAAKAGLIAMGSVNFLILLYNYFLAGDDLIKVICPIAAGISVLFLYDYKLNKRFWTLALACVFAVGFVASLLMVLFGVSFSVAHTYG